MVDLSVTWRVAREVLQSPPPPPPPPPPPNPNPTPHNERMMSQITGVSTVYPTICSGADQTEHQNSASLAFVRGIHRWRMNSPHKGPVTRKTFPFNDVIIMIFHSNNFFIQLNSNQSSIAILDALMQYSEMFPRQRGPSVVIVKQIKFHVKRRCICYNRYMWNFLPRGAGEAPQNLTYTIRPVQKCPPYCSDIFKWKLLYMYSILTEMCSQEILYEWASIGLDNDQRRTGDKPSSEPLVA